MTINVPSKSYFGSLFGYTAPMIKKILTTFLISFSGMLLLAQQKDDISRYSDSLLHKAKQAGSDSLRIEQYLALSNFWSDRDSVKAYGFINEAKKYMPANNNYYAGLVHFYNAGIIYARDIERAKNEYLKADKRLENYNSRIANRYRARLWNNYGTLLQLQDNDEGFLDILINKALPFATKARDSVLMATDLHNIGILLMNINDYDQADEYYLRAVSILQRYPAANEDRLTVFVNAAKNAIYSRKFMAARRHLDSASIQIKIIPHSFYAPVYYLTEGNYYRSVRQKDRALRNFNTGLRLAAETKDPIANYDLHYGKHSLYMGFREYPLAKRSLDSALNYLDGASLVSHRLNSMKAMSDVEYKLANYQSAYKWLRDYNQLRDTVYDENTALDVIALERKFKAVEKENEILKLKEYTQGQQLLIEQNRRWILILVAGLAVLSLLLYLAWLINKHSRRTLVQAESLHLEKLKSLRQQEKITEYNSMLQGQEKERARIARDLHDGLGGMLAGVKLKLSSISSAELQISPHSSGQIIDVTRQLDHAVDELRRVARNMMPASLLYMGLEPALNDLCKHLSSDTTQIRFEAIGLQEHYGEELSLAVYRIVQELLKNALTHARANEIIVQCTQNERVLYLTVEDDGIGFDEVSASQKEGIGLSNVKNRVDLLNGTIEIESTPGKGASFYMEIPVFIEQEL